MSHPKSSADVHAQLKVQPYGFCSFCLRPSDEIGLLIQSKGFPICEDCIRTCCQILSDRAQRDLDQSKDGWVIK